MLQIQPSFAYLGSSKNLTRYSTSGGLLRNKFLTLYILTMKHVWKIYGAKLHFLSYKT
jgi:hypothetical protein